MNNRIYIWCLLLGIGLLGACGSDGVGRGLPDYAAFSSLEITCPDTLLVGEPLYFNIKNQKENDSIIILKDVRLLVSNLMGSTLIEVDTILNNRLEIDTIHTLKSGFLWAQFLEDDKPASSYGVDVRPRRAIGYIDSYIGPKSILTTTSEPCMTIAVPVDTFDNPVATGTPNTYRLIRPNLSQEKHDKETDFLLTYHIFYAQQTQGKTLVGLGCDDANTKEKYADEEPGWPYEMGLVPVGKTLQGDGRQYTTIKTTVVKDKLGNAVMDGTLVTFIVREEDMTYDQYSAVTVDGVAKIKFRHPFKTVDYQVQAYSGNVRSKTIKLSFTSRVNDFDVKWDEEGKQLEIGPITSYLGQHIPEGSMVLVRFLREGKEMQREEVPTYRGMAYLPFNELFLEAGEHDLSVAISDKEKIMKINFKNER